MLKNLACALCSAVIGLVAAAPESSSGSHAENAAKAPKTAAETLNQRDLKWGAAPPVFPKGAQLAVLHGNPFAPGAFAVRLKLPDGYKIAPQCQDEHLAEVADLLTARARTGWFAVQ